MTGSRQILTLVLLFGLALATRSWGIGKEPLWLDELFSVRFSDHSVREVLSNSAWDVHPPFYYLGLYAWRGAFGDSAVRFRAYSVFWSLIGLAAVFLLTRDIAGPRSARIALLLGAVNPLDVYFAQEARMYTQTAALGILSSWLLWRWMNGPRLRLLAAYGACALALVLTHYLGALILLAQGLFALTRIGRKDAAAYLATALAVSIGVLPWLAVVLSLRGSIYRASGLGWIERTGFLESFSFLGRELFWGPYSTPGSAWIWTLAATVGLVVLARRTGYVLSLLFAPVLLAVVLSAVYHPIYFQPRFAELVAPAFFVLAGIACDSLPGRWSSWLAAGVLAGVMTAGTVLQWQHLQKEPVRNTDSVSVKRSRLL
jgi:hypothetical protein